MFTTEESARELVKTSPIRYHLTTAAPQPQPATAETAPATSSEVPPNITPTDESTTKVFELHISNAVFDHQRHIEEQPLHGPYTPVDPEMSYAAASLDEVIQPSLWSDGLRDWDTYKFKWRRDMVHEQVAGWNEKDDTSTAYRMARREKERVMKATPEVMTDLAGVVERYQVWGQQKSENTEAPNDK